MYYLVLFFCATALATQCKKGACCDVTTGLVRTAGTPCEVSTHPCLEASATCDGVSPKCSRKFKPDNTTCLDGGVCQRGLCYKDGKALEYPNKSYASAAFRTIAVATRTKEEPQMTEDKEEDDGEILDPIIVHQYEDSIIEVLRHLPELARMRQKKHEIEEKKLKAFRKVTHLVIRKHTEQLENQQLFYRRSKVRLQDEMQDMNNLHRHLHLHHKQNHGLDKTVTEEIEEMGNNLLQAVAGTETETKAENADKKSSNTGYYALIAGIAVLAVIAIVLVAVIIVSVSKAAKPARKDYY